MKKILLIACSLVLSFTVFSQPSAKQMMEEFILVQDGGFARGMEFNHSLNLVKEIEAQRVNVEQSLEEVKSKFDQAIRFTLNFDQYENYATMQYYFTDNKLELLAVIFYADEDAKINDMFKLLSKYYLNKDKSFWLVEEKSDSCEVQGKHSRFLLNVKLKIEEDEYGKYLTLELRNVTPY